MKRVLEFVAKTNQVLLFLVAIAILSLVAREFVGDIIRPRRESSVQIVTRGDTPSRTLVKDVRFTGIWFNWYVFEIAKDEVGARSPDDSTKISAVLGSSDGYANKTIVNIVFSDGGSRVRYLLPVDGLVLERRMSYANERERQDLRWHAFQCVTEDTNQDRKLDASDRNDLYLVSRDPSRPDIVLKDVSRHWEISPDEIVYSTGEGGAKRFWKLDLESSETTELSWQPADR